MELRMEDKEQNIKYIKQHFRQFYSDLKFLTEKQAKLANKERDRLLDCLPKSKRVKHSFLQSKIHTGGLSPGCLICGKGYWSCMYLNALCTANCFYCPQDRKIKTELNPSDGTGIAFDNPEDYLGFLDKFHLKGVGFSGGETLLVIERLLTYIEQIRKRFGKRIYLWMYTNGDLVNKDKIIRLKQAGLDEIRFNISARNYDLGPVKLATDVMDMVTVEIPIIPEDYEAVKKSLRIMQNIGVKYLNIHQLMTTKHNYKNYIDRGYTFLHNTPGIPILESEVAALRLIRYALDKKIGLPINYCSSAYKQELQRKGWMERIFALDGRAFEELTGARFIRRISIEDSPEKMKNLVAVLRKKKIRPNLWSLNSGKTALYMHSSLLKYVDFGKHNFTVSYFEPQLLNTPDKADDCSNIKLNSKRKIFIKRHLKARQKGFSRAAFEGFQNIFLKNMNKQEALRSFYKSYDLRLKSDLKCLKRETELLNDLKCWERVKTGFPEIY